MTIKQALPKTKEGLPKEAFAIVGDPDNTETWKLPHHKKSIFRAFRGKLDIEKTVDWDRCRRQWLPSPQVDLGGRE